MLTKVIEMIEAQQGTEDKNPHRWMIGEQLKEICNREPKAAELVAQDLENPSMGLDKLQNKFDSYAAAHKHGSSSVITPKQGEKLIREFYGIPDSGEKSQPVSNTAPSLEPTKPGKVISLFDLL